MYTTSPVMKHLKLGGMFLIHFYWWLQLRILMTFKLFIASRYIYDLKGSDRSGFFTLFNIGARHLLLWPVFKISVWNVASYHLSLEISWLVSIKTCSCGTCLLVIMPNIWFQLEFIFMLMVSNYILILFFQCGMSIDRKNTATLSYKIIWRCFSFAF